MRLIVAIKHSELWRILCDQDSKFIPF